MKINYHICAVFAFILLFTACKQITDTAKKGDEGIVNAETPGSPTFYPANGTHIIAPELTRMLSDTMGIVMYELILEPGDSLAWHQHPHHTFYVLEGGTLAVSFDGWENLQTLELPAGFANFGPPSGDVAVNIGESTLKLLMHDIYSLNPNE